MSNIHIFLDVLSTLLLLQQSTYLSYNKFCMALTEAVWRCSGKKLLLKFTQNYRENTCVGDSFSGRPATLLERDSNTGVFMWILGHFEEHLWTTAFASRILHSSKQHCGSRCQIKQNSNKRTKKYSLKLRGSPAHIPD